jgi:hypothetical protein
MSMINRNPPGSVIELPPQDSPPLDVIVSQEEGPPKRVFPPFMSMDEMVKASAVKPPVLIEGLLHRGSKMVLGGGSKSFKTFGLLDMSLSVATGTPWWGRACTKAKTLFINFEIDKPFFGDRISAIKWAKDIKGTAPNFHAWNMRGVCYNLEELIPELEARIAGQDFGLITIDPLYKCLGDLDENKAGDMAKMLNTVEQLALKTGAAVVFGSHFAKGNASGKESMDRISGSGVFARDPDAIMTMTRHEEDDCFAVEATVRNFPPVDPFVVRWQHPLMVPDMKIDPSRLRKSSTGRSKATADDLLAKLPMDGARSGAWEAASGMSHGVFNGLRRELMVSERVTVENHVYKRAPKAD